ncbi:uncharacterized protein LOC122245226 [Penaeus japonicus]|uniref:uncharacterized protein LOC122245226 n=1 Tax=Penaeus japonicus TaxID=27405 RepID=UPI001C71010F|nr:uncharacterized protein LOC122245226 [Penaeus japonicus]
MARRCTVGSCICGISLRDGTLMIAVAMLILSIMRLTFSVINICNDRIEGYFGMLVEVINLPLAGLLLFAVLRDEENLFSFWVWNTSVVAGATLVYGCIIIEAVNNLSDGVASVAMAFVQLYFMLVVRSHGFSFQSSSEIV